METRELLLHAGMSEACVASGPHPFVGVPLARRCALSFAVSALAFQPSKIEFDHENYCFFSFVLLGFFSPTGIAAA